MTRRTELRIESLERRDTPSLFGVPWANAQNLTLSFASDGVKASPIDGYGNYSISELFKELNTHIPTATWQFEILKAFQTWAAPANINIGLVQDNSTSFGDFEADLTQTPNGELRIGAVPMSPEVAGLTTPYHLLSGLRAGDVLLNQNLSYDVGGQNGRRDLYSVMLNEAANALGLDDTTDIESARYGRYTGVRTGINPSDRLAIVGMYGARQNDIFDAGLGNGTFALATPLTATNPASSTTVFIATADGTIASTSDVDTYRVTTRSNTTQLFVRLNTAGRSLFTGRVEVFNASQQLVASRSVTSPLSGDINFTVPSSANATFFVRVTPARSDAFGIGTYRLQVGLNSDPRNFTPPPPPTFINYGNDNRTDEVIGQHKTLTVTTPGYAPNTRFTARGVLEGNGDRDMYAVTVPSTGRPLSVILSPLKAGEIKPEVHVYSNTSYAWVPPNKLVQSADGRWVAQFSGLTAGQTVYLNVKNIDGTAGSGGYELVADFNAAPVSLTTLVAGSTRTADTLDQVSMAVPESTFFHFALEAWNDQTLGVGTHVQMSIINSAGQTVATLTGGNGMNTAQVFLPAGTYTVRFQGKDARGNNVGGVWYNLRAARLTDPIDVFDPLDNTNCAPPVTITTIGSGGTNDPYYITDPWSDPIG